jgi:hypothetical protein
MSMYNMLFGMNPDADKLLSLLDATRDDFGRFRNVYVADGYIVVHTRCGGGNRDDYFPEWVEDHPWYSHDEDDDFDTTYADIYFKIPEDKLKTFVSLLDQGENPAEQWDALYKALKA